MFQKVSDWFGEKSGRFVRGDAGAPGSYYGTNEAEQAYGRMQMDAQGNLSNTEPGVDTYRTQPAEPFTYSDKDHSNRSPYQSQQEATFERDWIPQEEQQVSFPQSGGMPNVPQGYAQTADTPAGTGYANNASVPVQRYAQPQMQPQIQYSSQPQQNSMGTHPAPATQTVQGQQNNVVPFPGAHSIPEGSGYSHVEYIMLLRSFTECKRIIEYIRSNGSVFLNMEFIANESERQRCVDMLSGAAYTLRCNLKRISPRGIYLISSPSVYLVIDPAIEKFATTPEVLGFNRQNYPNQGTLQQKPQNDSVYQGRDDTTSHFGTPSQTGNPSVQHTGRRTASPYAATAMNRTQEEYMNTMEGPIPNEQEQRNPYARSMYRQ